MQAPARPADTLGPMPSDAKAGGSRHRRFARAGQAAAGPRAADSPGDRRPWLDLLIVLLLTGLCFAAFANALHGDFIYDDQRQIVDNYMIQEPGLLWEACLTHSWRFAEEWEQLLGNYWRPVFTLYLGLNYRLWGLDDTFGWHVMNVLVHALVTALAYGVMRRLGMSRLLAALGAAVFAIHPVHVESVAWVSGAPDPLLGVGALGALFLLLGALRRERPLARTMASISYVGALLCAVEAQASKEAAIVLPAIVLVVGLNYGWRSAPLRSRWMRSAALTVPFCVIGAAYLVVRTRLLGYFSQPIDDAPGLTETILTTPAIGAFYLRQAFLPIWIGPTYPLRAVGPDQVSLATVYIPLLVMAGAAAAMLWVAWRDRASRVGLAIWAALLAPALNIAVFYPERIVQDRYLYLPLLGAVIIAFAAVRLVAQRVFRAGEDRARHAAAAFALAAMVPLAVVTVRYNTAWTSFLDIWAWGVKSDPTSAFTRTQYALSLSDAAEKSLIAAFHARQAGDEAGAAALDAQARKDMGLARDSFDIAIEREPLISALMGRANVAMMEGRLGEAEVDLRKVLATRDDFLPAYERLALLCEQQGRFGEAERILRAGRDKIESRRAALTANLAVVLYKMGRKQEALEELTEAQDIAATERNDLSRLVFFHLGNLLEEMRRRDEARAAFTRFLALTEGLDTPMMLEARRFATAAIERLGG